MQDVFPQLDADRILELIGPDLVREIQELQHAYWAPMVLDVALTEAIVTAVKVPRARDFFRKNLLKSFDSPVFRTLIHTSTSLLNLQMSDLARWFRHGFDLVYRDAGEMVVAESEPDCVVLEWRSVPPGLSGTGGYLEGTAGALEAVFELAKRKNGRVDVDFDSLARCARFRLHWSGPC